MPAVLAHPAADAAASTSRTIARRVTSAARSCIDDIGAPWNLEDEHLVVDAGILPIGRESERRAATLLVSRREPANLQRRPIDLHHQPIVVALFQLGVEAQRPRVGGATLGVADVEVA